MFEERRHHRPSARQLAKSLTTSSRADRAEARESSRRSRPMAMGASVSASFIGLLTLDADWAQAGVVADPPADGSSPARAQQVPGGPAEASSDTGVPQTAAAAPVPGSISGSSSTSGIPIIEPVRSFRDQAEAGTAQPAHGQHSVRETDMRGVAEAPAAPFAVEAAASGVSVDFGIDAAELPEVDLAPEPPIDEELGDIGVGADGTPGDDDITRGDADDNVDGGAGDDRITAGGGNDSVTGGPGRDQIFGGAGDDELDGGTGDDELHGGEGADVLRGGEGDDLLAGGEGSDELWGGAGDDVLDGGAGGDVMRGGLGDDRYVIDDIRDVALEDRSGPNQGGRDTIEVRDGYAESVKARLSSLSPEGLATFVIGGAVVGALPEEANSFRQQVDSDIENIRFEGAAAHDAIGDDRSNELFGNDGANTLWGEGGDDALAGGSGDDILYGGDGDDMLAGEEGADMLYGGAGDDTFVFGLAESGVDRIFDHEGATRIEIEEGDIDAVGLRRDGDDLVISHEDRDIARIEDHDPEDADLDTISAGGETRSFNDFLVDTLAEPASEPETDILADYFGEATGFGADPDAGSPDGAWLSLSIEDSGLMEAKPASFRYEEAAADMLQGFMNASIDPFTGQADVTETRPTADERGGDEALGSG